MTYSNKPLLAVLQGEVRTRPPVWLMRQAGRYLPEYRALRAQKGGFLALATDPAAAAEVTIQPIRRFGFDGAILFSDILMVPWALGQDLSFGAGEGPRLAPALIDRAFATLQAAPERLLPVYETVRLVAAALPPEARGRSRPTWSPGRDRRTRRRRARWPIAIRRRSGRSSWRSPR